jgi:seryl-tRNA synthetase
MLDLKALIADPKKFKDSLSARSGDPTEIDRVIAVNDERRKVIAKAETLKAQQNKMNQEIAQAKRDKADATQKLSELKEMSMEVKRLEAEASVVDDQVRELLERLPNLCHSTTPVGTSEKDNKEMRKFGEIPKIQGKPLEHWELGEKLGILDFERGTKVAGARFTFVRGQGARLERALINFMLDIHTKSHGYQEMVPPFIVNRDSMRGTGQLPKFEEDLFHLDKVDYFLIPTAEVPVTNFYKQETLNESQLPQAFVAYSPCFRAEAGSYGKDTKGLIRQHQFNKVEVMRFVHPSKSYEELELLTGHAEKILQTLELPYRVMALSTADIGFGAAKTYDLEVWLPGQNMYREISSCSNYEDFQARRANIRFKPAGGGKPEFVHTLNGSGLAVGRTLVAILENFQQQDGSVLIPKALQPYCGFDRISVAQNR